MDSAAVTLGTLTMGGGDGKSAEQGCKASTVTCIYLNSASTLDLWEHQKKDFLQGQGHDDEYACITDEVFVFHLLTIHAQFCAESSCKCRSSSGMSGCDVIGESEIEHLDIKIKTEPNFAETSDDMLLNSGWISSNSSSGSECNAFPDPSGFTELERQGQGPSEVDRHLNAPAERSLDAKIDRLQKVAMESPDSESHDHQRDLAAIESSDSFHDQHLRKSLAMQPPDVSHDLQRELVSIVTMELEEIKTEEGTMYEENADHREGDETTSREKWTSPNLVGVPGKQALQEGETCAKGFIQKSDPEKHYRTHTDGRPLKCEVCSRAFSRKHNLVDHMRTHSGKRSFTCSICSKGFTKQAQLLKHQRTHTGERPFVCNVCSKAFSDKSNLTAHMRTHTGERPFTCSICKKGFRKKWNLKEHLRTHTGPGERPFICVVCSKAFSDKSNLKVHMMAHTGKRPFICNVCSKAFSDKSNLTAHMRIHTGERPFTCSICKKGFRKKWNLKKHLMTHTGERPFICVVCSKAFSDKSNLTVHMKAHTGERSFI